MILYICNTVAVGLFGIILSAAFCNIRWDRKNVLWMAAATVAIYILQAVVYFGIDTTRGQYLYPIHTHLTLAIVLCVLSRQRLWPVISVLTAYLCCQLRRWLALVIVAVFSGGDRMQYIAEMALTIPLLILLLREQGEPVKINTGCSFESTSKKYVVDQIVNYFEDHYSEKISLDQIAENMYLSPFYISRIFKSETGDTPIRHLINIRLEKAKELLENGFDGSIQEVAAEVGYDDVYHFSKLFKKRFGMPPSKTRKLL